MFLKNRALGVELLSDSIFIMKKVLRMMSERCKSEHKSLKLKRQVNNEIINAFLSVHVIS